MLLKPLEVVIPEPLVVRDPVPHRTEPRGDEAIAALLPCRCSVTRPASSRMRRCWETAGRLISKCPAIVLTERSASRRRSSIRRRAGWLIAPKTSGLRSGVTTMLSIYVRKHLRVKSEVGLVVLDARVHQESLHDSPRIIRCRFIILARKDELTPDYQPSRSTARQDRGLSHRGAV